MLPGLLDWEESWIIRAEYTGQMSRMTTTTGVCILIAVDLKSTIGADTFRYKLADMRVDSWSDIRMLMTLLGNTS